MRSIADQLSSSLGRNDEVPNTELARTIAAARDAGAIGELVALLDDPRQAIRSDALKVLYETGKLELALIAGHAERFAQLLDDRHNRMVWGSMEALASIATVDPIALLPHLATIKRSTASGSVITRDWGVRALASIAESLPDTRLEIVPFLVGILATCRPSELPRHLESCASLLELDPAFASDAHHIAIRRLPELTPPQAKRTKRILRAQPQLT